MPYTMFIYDINDDAVAPKAGDVFRVSEVVPNVMDWGMFGGTGTHVVLEPIQSTPDKEFHICRMCDIHHIDNCGTCFGFGLRWFTSINAPSPVTADEAHGKLPMRLLFACPECGSTIRGLPSDHGPES